MFELREKFEKKSFFGHFNPSKLQFSRAQEAIWPIFQN